NPKNNFKEEEHDHIKSIRMPGERKQNAFRSPYTFGDAGCTDQPKHFALAAAIGIDYSLERRRQSLRRCLRAKDTSRGQRSAGGRHPGFKLQQLAKSSGNRN